MIEIIIKPHNKNPQKVKNLDSREITAKINMAAHAYFKHKKLIENTPRISAIRKSMDSLYAASTSISACIANMEPIAAHMLDNKINNGKIQPDELEILKIFMYDGTSASQIRKQAVEKAFKTLANCTNCISNELTAASKDNDFKMVEDLLGQERMNLVMACFNILNSCNVVIEYSYGGNLGEFICNMFSYIGIDECDPLHYINRLKIHQQQEAASLNEWNAESLQFNGITMKDLLEGMEPYDGFHEDSKKLTDEDVEKLSNAGMNLTRARLGAVPMKNRKRAKKLP